MLPSVAAKVDQMKGVDFHDIPMERKFSFTNEVMASRWEKADEEVEVSGYTSDTVSDIFTRRRGADRSTDVWTMYNVAQENIIKGRAVVVSYPRGVSRKSTAVTGIARSVQVNRDLWDADERLVA